MHLSLDYPWYFILFCLAGGAIVAGLLYFIPIWRGRSRFKPGVAYGLAAIRFLAVALILFLTLSPLVTRPVHEKEKPVVIVAQDNSRSIRLSKDSLFYASDYQDKLNNVACRLASDYDVDAYTFGARMSDVVRVTGRQADGIKADYSENATDIGAVFKTIADIYDGCNVGAVILATDGICTKGRSPLAAARQTGLPVFAVALGDTTLLRDVGISHVRHNQEAALNHKFPVEVTVTANRLKGQKATLSISHDGHTLCTKEITYTSDRFSATESFTIEADKPGLQTYKANISVLDGEHSSTNNVRSFHIKVSDKRQQVAIVAATPHPDVAALRRALEAHEGMTTQVFTAEEFGKNADNRNFDLVVLHQLPTEGSANICRQLAESKTPAIYVLGSQTDLAAFNSLQLGVSIQTNLKNTTTATAVANRSFVSFAIDDAVSDLVAKQAPLQAPFGNYEVGPSIQTLFFAKIGNIDSDIPLIAVARGETRNAFVFGEGLWRWRLGDLAENGESLFFDQLVTQLVQYVSTREKAKRLKVTVPEILKHDEPVVMRATLSDDNLQPTNTPDVALTVTDSSKSLSYTFNRHGSGYSANLGFLAEGRYSYRAQTTLAGKTYADEGVFVVAKNNIEEANLTADHTLLQTIATETGGRLVSPDELDSLYDWLHITGGMKTVIHTHNANHPLLNLWWILLLIITLLAAEWGIRKYHGEL